MHLAYIAGLVDGEGTISLTYYPPRGKQRTPFLSPQVAVTNTNLDFLEEIQQRLGGRINKLSDRGNRKDCWVLQLRFPEIKGLLTQLYPYLRVKRQQATLLLEFLVAREGRTRKPKDPKTGRWVNNAPH